MIGQHYCYVDLMAGGDDEYEDDDYEYDDDEDGDEADEDTDDERPYRIYKPPPPIKVSAITPKMTFLEVYRFLAAFKSLKIFWVSGLRVVSVFSLAI